METEFLGRVSYERAAGIQAEAVAARARGDTGDVAFLVEHDPVVTLGRSPASRLDANQIIQLEKRGVEIVQSDRGGGATYHGPGQLVVYPVVSLRERGNDAHGYLRSLERLIIEWLGSYGVEARIEDGLTGVWTDRGKIAAIGVGVRQGVGFHGFAVNLDPDLPVFRLFDPCGLDGSRVTSMFRETGSAPTLEEAAGSIAPFVRKFLEGSESGESVGSGAAVG